LSRADLYIGPCIFLGSLTLLHSKYVFFKCMHDSEICISLFCVLTITLVYSKTMMLMFIMNDIICNVFVHFFCPDWVLNRLYVCLCLINKFCMLVLISDSDVHVVCVFFRSILLYNLSMSET
jgi:hypothetical protein